MSYCPRCAYQGLKGWLNKLTKWTIDDIFLSLFTPGLTYAYTHHAPAYHTELKNILRFEHTWVGWKNQSGDLCRFVLLLGVMWLPAPHCYLHLKVWLWWHYANRCGVPSFVGLLFVSLRSSTLQLHSVRNELMNSFDNLKMRLISRQ